MISRSRGRQGDLEARREWTARLNKFAAARTSKQRQAALDAAFQINPGKTIRDLLQAWGYSASARGRKGPGAPAEKSGKTARERLEETLDEMFGAKPTPVPSLYAKLAGRADTTVTDAWQIVSALVFTWPGGLEALAGVAGKDSETKARSFADIIIRELLAELSEGRSRQWSREDMDIRGFRLIDEERIGASAFVSEAGEKEGALIVAAARDILIGPHPTEILSGFHHVTSQFIEKDHKGILIFVFDTAVFEAGKEGFNILYNIGLLSTAITAFALFPENYDYKYPIQQHQVDWSRWRALSTRCCVVIRKPPLIDPRTGILLKRDKFDDYIAEWRPDQEFARLEELRGFVQFDSGHVLPRTYPTELRETETLLGHDLYWDVLVRPLPTEPEGLEVRYFIPPHEQIAGSIEKNDNFSKQGPIAIQRSRGRPSNKPMSIEEDLFYVIKRNSPGARYDDAQRAIYLAARGRLRLDLGDLHARNLNAAAALRQVGFEVLPISILLSLFPRALHFAAGIQPDEPPTGNNLDT